MKKIQPYGDAWEVAKSDGHENQLLNTLTVTVVEELPAELFSILGDTLR